MKNINYAQVYGDEVDEVIKDSVNLPRHFSELSPEIQRLF